MLRNDYQINARRSLIRAERAISHLSDFFGHNRAIAITSDRISAYVAFRKRAGAANATINREFAALRRMFRLGKRAGKVGEVPFISLLQEDNVRTGFFEPGQFQAVLRHLPDDLKPVVEVAYIGELRGLLQRNDTCTLALLWLPSEHPFGKGFHG